MNDDDLRALARLLEDFGLGFGVTAADGRPAIGNERLRHGPAGGPPLRLLTLADGRQLVLADRRPADGAADERHATLVEHAQDLMVAVDEDLVMRYASPAARALLGRAPEVLCGHTVAELLAPDDRAAFITCHFTQAARRAGGPDLFRALRGDGRTLWVEVRVSPLPAGHALGRFLVTLRDADRRQQAEQALAGLNAELAALAATDALTGLPNRRRFDEALHKEWYRALRDRAPLGLLMVDIDRFKSLNDVFGHPVGDAVLQRVGRVIRDTVRRAGDLPTRYGGEEFAIVLPGTTRQGAMELAEAIRRAVAATDLGDVIDGGHPVSVSIGVATAVPRQQSSAPALLHAADAALYAAKRGGRNRVACAQDPAPPPVAD